MTQINRVFKGFKHMKVEIQDIIKEYHISNNPNVYSPDFIREARFEMNTKIKEVRNKYHEKAIQEMNKLLEETTPKLPGKPKPEGILTQEKLLSELIIESKRANDLEYFKRVLPKKNTQQLEKMVEEYKENHTFYEILEDELANRLENNVALSYEERAPLAQLQRSLFEAESPYVSEMNSVKQALNMYKNRDEIPMNLEIIKSMSDLNKVEHIPMPK
ncbi:hypothetical protein [Kurthia sibirica]|uniref:hypothetical protein n=1 Tax=Kurthia sibirica TaxID=202750 RepID=UPI00116E93DE|nr:hypothetical protein [Kurthia sibirica]GEK35447.1 hypothetical protein KSI01_29800 [Kurthia sibirica]